ncbi:hypothetical protein ALP71_05772 [Pseudomonas coronafaciens pv. garcae]|nr:hypothetical protein ALP71_05772 [Pseudomonas coronafaciens pv. garcae]
MLDGFATQYRQLASPRIARAQLPIGFRQVIADQPKQQRLDFRIVQQVHLKPVFQVDQGVADVIGGFHQVNQRVTRPALLLKLGQAELAGYLLENRQFALVAAELVLLVAQRIGMTRRPRVLEVSAQGGVGQASASVELMVFQLRQHSETLRVAFEIEEVVALGFAHRVEPASSGGLIEPVANGIFARVAERGIADIVGQAGRLYDHAQVARVAPVGQGGAQGFADAHAQRPADATDFQRVGQTSVDMIVAGHRVDLCLATQTAERSGKDDPVVVLVEWAASEFFGAVQGLAESFAVKQGLPIQGGHSVSSYRLASRFHRPAARPRTVTTGNRPRQKENARPETAEQAFVLKPESFMPGSRKSVRGQSLRLRF